jgi:hypothetical protein
MFMLHILAFLLAANPPAPVPPDPVLAQEQAIAAKYEAAVHIAALPFTTTPEPIQIVTTPQLSFIDKNAIHEGRYAELPPPVKAIFDRWAAFTGDQPTGNALFDDMFYRFFFVHELGHWTIGQVLDHRSDAGKDAAIANEFHNHWQTELECNRLSIAWWREHDPAYLARIVADFRKIQAHIPNPVPPGQDMQIYFAANYQKLGEDPNVYGWFLLQSVILAYDEPVKSFQARLDELPTMTFS